MSDLGELVSLAVGSLDQFVAPRRSNRVAHGLRAATLVERHSRFVMLVKVDGKSSPAVVNALIKQVRHLPQELRKSLTWDRGLEMAQHKDFSVATQVDVYFCGPRSSWQRGRVTTL